MSGPTGMTINLDQLPIRKCKKCGGTIYVQTFQLRYCSAIQSPVGKAGLIFIQTGFSCAVCTTSVVDMTEKPPEEPKEEKPDEIAQEKKDNVLDFKKKE